MNIFKKILISFILIAFCTTSAGFAIDADAINLKKADVFDDNYQSLYQQNSVHAQLSAIEKMYNGKENAESGTILRQVGYNQFNSISGTNSSATGKYSGNYKLSIGEKVNIYTYGDSVDVLAMSGNNLVAPSSKAEVSSNGSIFVSGIGLVQAENRTLQEVENELNAKARAKYRNMRVKLTISSGSEFSVFVYGEVARPGKVYVGNNSSILDALSAAGGVKKTGTLRNITYNGKTGSVDLYKTLFSGNDSSIIVKPNDKIFVDKIGDTIAVKNGVTIPGIYEIKKGETVQDIVNFSGGLLATTQTDSVVIVGFDKELKQKTARNVTWDEAVKTKLVNGDTFEFTELYNNAENTVVIQGNIKHPATYAYKEGMRLSDILKSENELLEETFIYQAVIRRVSGPNNTVETIPVFLKEFFAGMNDPVLKPRDVITVYKSTNSQFVDVYGCINTPKHLAYTQGMNLNDVMSDIKFMESEIKDKTEVATQTSGEDGNIQLSVSTENLNKLIPTENVAVEIISKSGATQLYYLYDIMINSDRIKSIALQPDDKVFFRTLRSNEVMKTVKISGFVKRPGVYTFVRGNRLIDIIELAGGLDEDADLRGIQYRRTNLKNKQVNLALKNNNKDIQLLIGRLASGYKQDAQDRQTKIDMITRIRQEEEELAHKYDGQISLNIKDNDLSKISQTDNVIVQDGDDIYIPRLSNYVSVIGEVYNEQSFTYKKGATVKKYIKEVGGYTPNANRFRIYKVSVNGKAEKAKMKSKVEPGDTIVVPRKIAGNDWIAPICDTLRGLASLFIMAFTINKW